MVPLLYHHASITPLFLQPSPTRRTHLSPFHIPVRPSHSRTNSTSNNRNRFDQNEQQQYRANLQRQPRTLFPGGYKRPEIKVPTFVLQLDPEEVLNGGNALDLIDKAVSKWVGIVVLKGDESSGGRLYKAACLLKSVVRDRAYLLVAERVDIAAAAGASGVLLSDQGLPAIVARNTLLDSKSDSVVLPLVAKNVKTIDAALDASKSEGADFLIYGIGDWKHVNLEIGSVSEKVKIPIFVMFTSSGGNVSYAEASNLLNSGSCGFVISLENFGLFNDDVLHKLLNIVRKGGSKTENEHQKFSDLTLVNTDNDFYRKDGTLAGFVKLGDREKQFIETERSVLIEAIQVIKKATPLMEEVSLLVDAVSQIDEPFMLVIVGEFNSGKSTVINALLGKRYLKEGVVPTTNEITFLRYADSDFDKQHCERHPDGQYICYLPAPILKEINIVDTPGTNVILQRQQRLTEEFVPRADLLLFVISADRPLTESEVAFLRYTQQWKKKVVFVLNKSDLYQNDHELEEAIRFIKDNTQKLLNIDSVTLYPVSARSALDAKLLASANVEKHCEELSVSDSQWRVSSFYELEKFLYSFLDGSTSSGMERMKLKLETPIAIADRLITSCDTLVKQDYRYAKQDLASVNDLVNSVNDFATKMENETITWRRQILALIDSTKSRAVELAEATLVLSNLDLVASYVFKGENYVTMSATSRLQNDIIGPAVSDAQKLLGEYKKWLQSKNTQQWRLYKESFGKRWPSFMHQNSQVDTETYELLKRVDQASCTVIENFSGSAASKLFEREIREIFLGTFGGLGAAGLSASLLTSVLPTTLEDLLALGICSAGGYLAISNFPTRRQRVIDKVKRSADALAQELDEAMKKDLLETIGNLETLVKALSQPYEDRAQNRLEKLLDVQDELSNVEKKLGRLQIEIQNLHMS